MHAGTTPRSSGAHRAVAATVAALVVVAAGACVRRPVTSPGAGGGASPTTAAPAVVGGVRTVTATIEVTGTFDGRGGTFRGGGDLGRTGDGEGKPPLFRLAPGGTVRNLTIGVPGSDGIHCLGTCRIENVTWTDVLDDAATLKGSSAADVMTISGGSAHHATDKVFQHNGPGRVVIENFTVEDFGKLYRSCGNCSTQYPRSVEIRDVTAIGPGRELAGLNVDNPGWGPDQATFAGVTVRDDPGRKLAICGYYRGVRSGEPGRAPESTGRCRGAGTVVWR